jgi:hypothetical protein
MRLRFLLILVVLLGALCFTESSFAQGVTVRGRLVRQGPAGVYPAVNIQVTLFSQQNGRTVPTVSGYDGMYYFYNIPPGPYNLEIWVGQNPIVHPVHVSAPNTDIPQYPVP